MYVGPWRRTRTMLSVSGGASKGAGRPKSRAFTRRSRIPPGRRFSITCRVIPNTRSARSTVPEATMCSAAVPTTRETICDAEEGGLPEGELSRVAGVDYKALALTGLIV